MSWLLRGLLIGAAIAVAGVAIAGTGGLAAAAIVGASAAAGAGLGELFSTMSWAPKEQCGFIVGACSSNVFTNGIRAARAHVDVAQCSKHSMPHPPIATGSATVFINGLPAARIEDSIACGAVITGGSNNVFIGGGVAQTDPIQPENPVPGWVHTALFAVGLGAAIVLGGPILAAAGTFGGLVGGDIGGRVGERFFGVGSDGQKWSMLAGSLAGGLLGVKGVPKQFNFHVDPAALGMSGGNIKFSPKYKTKPMDSGYATEEIPGNSAPNWRDLPGGALVKYLSPMQREKAKLHFKDGKIYTDKGRLFDTSNANGGKAIFVMDESGKFYASNHHDVGEFHHSSLLAGKPVAAAGEIDVTEGVITAISNRSGHYKPSHDHLMQAIKELRENEIDMRFVLIDVY
ncbi:PAAR domain-containing protein [Noviherbaspirillum aerium]|uniref:PAAR domain-containing protein n=1 Tax=Noviherbaspirillum aerium TaxID=2588497 RepID=UPI00178C6B1B|nr:PAAR domain-containing protein [Noviherbaspirillum aerium]